MNGSNVATRVGSGLQRGFAAIKTLYAAAIVGLVSVLAAPLAMAAGGGGSPGSAIADSLADAPADMGLVFTAVAILIGLLLVWAYVKRSAK